MADSQEAQRQSQAELPQRPPQSRENPWAPSAAALPAPASWEWREIGRGFAATHSPPTPPPPPPPRPLPVKAAPQPSWVHGISQITSSLYISNSMAANNRFLLSSNRITTVINVSVEVVNTFFEDIQYLKVPVTDSPSARICDFFDPIADHIHSVEMKQGRTLVHCAAGVSRSATVCMAFLMKYHTVSLLDAHTWTKCCRPIIRPNNGFWEQLIHYEYKLFTKNTVQMIDSPVGMVPDVYQKEFRLMMSM
ncbi:PREDICTED: dual specificity protein phosphatase 21 [Miniopterus natalensis]|uniref:dual specificity protein phosphatase 21 n=1 Tax=Miniopterus natalensis TaxID=291302 RepID=UPI0007A6D253|nr:PREDICTED: dual specificity protein phosphatase 21 [Miniopterus natalensis]